MQKKWSQYDLTTALSRKHSHTRYLASPVNPQTGHGEPEHQVVLTLFASALVRFPHERENLLQKARRLKELQHPHLVPILDTGIAEGQLFIVREYLPQGSLRSRLKKLSPERLMLREALSIIVQVGEALLYAHRRNIVHGNIKPENILLKANGQACLTDFSLVERKDAVIRDQTAEEYAFCYLAPEQFAGTCDSRSDQYALGCLAYELMSGRVPFAAQSLSSMMGRQSNVVPVPLSASRADLPPSLETAVLKTLAKDPEERFFDFSLFLEVIQSIVSLSPVFPFTNAPHSPRTRTLSHSPQSAKAEIVVSPIRKRASKHSAPQQPEPSHAFFNAVADMAELAIAPVPSTISQAEWAGIISSSESPALILQPHQFTSPPSGNTDLASNEDNDSPNQPRKEQSHQEASVIIASVLSSHEIGTRASEQESTIGSNAKVANTDSPDPLASSFHDDAVFPSEPQSNANQTDAQEDADNVWLTNLFEEQESRDLPATGSVSLEQEQHESDKDTRYEMIVSLPKDSDGGMPLRRQTRHNRRKFLGVMLLCFVIVASGTYAAFFPLRTSTPSRLVRPTHIVNQALIPVQSSISPTQLTVPAIPTPTATAQPTPQITTIPVVVPTPTPTPRPVVRQILTVDDRVEGSGVNQFNYVGSGWEYESNICDANPCEYNNSVTWDCTPNDYVTLTFIGVQIRFYSLLYSKHGIGAVSLDGGSETMVDLYAATRAGDQLVWTSPMVSAGTHTFKLRVTGNKNPSSSGICGVVDRVDILS